jgi:hypothetical protein
LGQGNKRKNRNRELLLKNRRRELLLSSFVVAVAASHGRG